MTENASGHTAHTDVGAYVLGVLGPDAAERFEEHLAGCARCAAELEELIGLQPLLAGQRAEVGAPTPPGPALLARLLAETEADRRTRRSRRMWLVAAAFALVVGGPVATLAVAGDDTPRQTVSAAQEMYTHGEKIGVTDPRTKAEATVSLERKPWGTHVALKLGDVRGPLSCELVAVGPRGEEQTVTTWAVPKGGYGIPGSGDGWSSKPLYAHGGAAFDRDEISRFVVRTLDGRTLASIGV